MNVNVQDFIAQFCDAADFRHGIYIPEDIRLELMRCRISGETVLEVPDDTIDRIEVAQREDMKRDKYYNDISALRLAGMKAEEDGGVEDAVEHYSEAIELGETCGFDLLHAYRHAYDRIFVLLARLHQYAREAHYIERLLKHQLQQVDREKLSARLQKTQSKIK